MNKRVYIPLFFALAVIGGILIGKILTERSVRQNYPSNTEMRAPRGKIEAMLNLIDMKYVDTLSYDSIVEKAIPKILTNLDPHSTYIPASDLQTVNEELDGSFSGIGIQFNIQNDTIMVVGVISGGPSEKKGILPGDRIVNVNDTLFVGKSISNDKVMKKLRGPKGTEVKIDIKRNGMKDLLPVTIVRGDIPITSLDAHYMIDSNIGYVRVNRFGATTYEEFFKAIYELKGQGAEKYIIDLRANPGGYLDQAILMINEFLEAGDMIVYTEGNSSPRNDSPADGNGRFKNNKVVVLIDEWSASASEIFAGAIQDNDRGTVIGRRSFGKGLVQQQFPMGDGSALRLTIARYYTPSGRCIQKPYNDYEKDIVNRYLHGELDAEDSIHVDKADSTVYFTKNGRRVYGGGGIMPDIFVPRDTTGMTSYYNKISNNGIIYEYAFAYADKNRELLKTFKTAKDLETYLGKANLIPSLATFAEEKGIRRNPNMIAKSQRQLNNKLNAYIARNILGDNAFFQILNQEDVTVRKAIEEISR
ncbi:MAG: S41 family peptidase [Paludibacteraceae bacterium]|nr:S41 family peptidase [Paludibacteraceae bacterium]